ncbi:MAG: hypothetical protein A2Y76_06945 [Planctomycetes bacterium RBG_13_60_9]|nr:MAG: hypothetical protein A2Y76_06945 [Planctomycetes bacterium RBG_13_60_9]
MGRSKGVTIGLCLAVVIGGGWICLAARSSDHNVPLAMADPNEPAMADLSIAHPADISLGSRELFAKMMLSVALVIVLGLAVLYVSRKVLPKVGNLPGKEIRIRETAYLGPRKALHLVEVGGHRLLIGSTNDHITALAHLTDTWLDLPKQEPEDMGRL